MAEGKVIPTRMELLKKKAQIKLAQKGHKLLKKKRDALIMEFFKILQRARDLRKNLFEKLQEGRKISYYASVTSDAYEIDVMAGLNKVHFELDVKEKNVMGVKIPQINYNADKLTEYPEFLASAQLDKLAEIYSEVFDIIIGIAEIETSLKRIIYEIQKTKRRVNALEFVVIPRLEAEQNMIKQRLEELERDSFVALKQIKKKLEKK